MNKEILELYIQSIDEDIKWLKEMGCNDERIASKLKNKYKQKLACAQTKNMYLIIDFVLRNQALDIDGKLIQFSREA